MKNIFLIFLFCFLLSNIVLSQNIEIDSLRFVVAKKGDGIYKILRENGFNPSKEYINEFVKINQSKIKDNNDLILGEKYFLPLNKDSIFLTKKNDKNVATVNEYSSDAIISNKLSGAIIYLIPGHGGPDPGAITQINDIMLSEDEYAYDICLRLAKRIEMNGGIAEMIIIDPNDSIRNDEYLKIDYDEICYPNNNIPSDHNERLIQRSKAVNDLFSKNSKYKYQRVIEIHLDSRNTIIQQDVFFYYFPNSMKGKMLAESIQNTFAEKYSKYQPNRGYKGNVNERNLLVMRKVIPPLVFIELGNIQNFRDRKRFIDYNNREAIAKWICEAIINDYGKM